jgi:hypothetical protein
VKHGQQLDQAWRFTLREFFAVADYNRERTAKRRGSYDHERLAGLEAHLESMGVT